MTLLNDDAIRKAKRKARNADFERRMLPRMLWPDSAGTLWRWRAPTPRRSKAKRLTEAEDNAIARAVRRRENRRRRAAGKPHACR